MEDQFTIRFPRDLSRALRNRAAQMQRRPSELVRMAVKEFLDTPEPSRERPAERVRHLIGSLDSRIPDLATRHREYIVKKLRRGR